MRYLFFCLPFPGLNYNLSFIQPLFSEKASELGWPLTLIIVSVLSAILGAILMVIVVRCRRWVFLKDFIYIYLIGGSNGQLGLCFLRKFRSFILNIIGI